MAEGKSLVMISYNQKSSKELAKALNDRLKSDNFKTWIDYEEIYGSCIGSMANAVESASALLCLITDEYCASKNCVLECGYAFEKNKPIIPIKVNAKYNPTGEVGMIVANKIYVDFSKNSFNDNYEKLMNQLNRHMKNSNKSYDTLYSNETLQSGDELISKNGVYHAVMQTDGNFVLYFKNHYTAENSAWNSRTCQLSGYKLPFFLKMQNDGNLVMHDANAKPCWATNTYGKGQSPHKLQMQDDGNLVIYDANNTATWHTNTFKRN